MEASAHSPAAQALSHMPRTPEPSPAPAATPDAGEAVAADAAAAGRTRIRDQVAENPLTALFGTVFVALLMFNFTITHSRISDTNDRITRLEASVDARFEAQDAKIDRLFAAQDAKIDEMDAKIDEINLKLTALIAALNATAEVDAALEGRLLDPDELVAPD